MHFKGFYLLTYYLLREYDRGKQVYRLRILTSLIPQNAVVWIISSQRSGLEEEVPAEDLTEVIRMNARHACSKQSLNDVNVISSFG